MVAEKGPRVVDEDRHRRTLSLSMIIPPLISERQTRDLGPHHGASVPTGRAHRLSV
jgi:hypothetical protein